jgi:cytochrome c-type biogenesis protein CcmH/NrfG
MPRYISRRARRNAIESTYERERDAQAQEYLRLLRRESEKLLKDFKEQIAQTMRQELEQSLRSASNSIQPSQGGASFAPSFSGVANFFTQALLIYLGRPKYSQFSSETQRSQQAATQFRASRSESLAELSGTLASGERNS